MVEDLQIDLAMHINAAFAVDRSAYTNTDAHSVTNLGMASGSVTPTRRSTTREALRMTWRRKQAEDKTKGLCLQILDIEGIGTERYLHVSMEKTPHAPPNSIYIDC